MMKRNAADLVERQEETITLPAEIIRNLAPIFEVSTTRMAALLGMSRHAVWRRIHRQEALPPYYQARAMGAIRLYVRTLGLYSYDTIRSRREARRRLNDWLRAPRVGFGGRKPIELLASDKEQKKLLRLMADIAEGLY